MSPEEFIAFWHADPFRPFRVHTTEGVMFDVAAASQVAMSPGRRLIVVMLADHHIQPVTPENIARCEVLTGPPSTVPIQPPAAPDPDQQDGDPTDARGRAPAPPGSLIFETRQDSGRPLVVTTIRDNQGRRIFSTADSPWDTHGVETFENGFTLYLSHADEIARLQRIIVWPPNRATLDSFSESASCRQVEQSLKALGAAIRAAPTPFAPHERYTRDSTREPVQRKQYGGRPDEPALEAPDRYTATADTHEVGPHHWAESPIITDSLLDDVLFDLSGSRWDGKGEVSGAVWTADLRCFPNGGRFINIRADLRAFTARVDGGPPIPLEFLERTLKNFELYEQWPALLETLARGPLGPGTPEVVFAHPGAPADWRIELWPGEARKPLPLVVPRIVGADGRAVVDLRGSAWGAIVEPWAKSPRVSFRFLNMDPEDRDGSRLWLVLDLPSRRVLCNSPAGATSLAMLHTIAHHCRSGGMLVESFTEALEQGRALPHPAWDPGQEELAG